MSPTNPKYRLRLVSLSEAADAFGISVKTIRRPIADGAIDGYRVGRLIRVDLNEVQDRLAIRIPTIH
jgi:excisionase family DNA binding protein